MAVTISVFDPTTEVTNTIQADVYATIVESDENGLLAFYIQLSTSAKNIGGGAIPSRYIRSLSTLAEGTRQHAVNTSSPYGSLTAAIEDFVLDMVEGEGGETAMAF